jgi:adenylate kinase
VAKGEVILMGPPGSGKGTQAKLLASDPGWIHLSTGDLFREHLRNGTDLGKLADRHMSKGEYVPDDVTVGMVRDRMREVARDDHVVFDGFPRTVAQAEALDGLLRERGRALGAVVLVDAPREELVGRLSSRASKEGRSDDTPEVIANRLDVYRDRTAPLVGHYEKRGLLRRVSGLGTVEEVAGRTAAAVG